MFNNFKLLPKNSAIFSADKCYLREGFKNVCLFRDSQKIRSNRYRASNVMFYPKNIHDVNFAHAKSSSILFDYCYSYRDVALETDKRDKYHVSLASTYEYGSYTNLCSHKNCKNYIDMMAKCECGATCENKPFHVSESEFGCDSFMFSNYIAFKVDCHHIVSYNTNVTNNINLHMFYSENMNFNPVKDSYKQYAYHLFDINMQYKNDIDFMKKKGELELIFDQHGITDSDVNNNRSLFNNLYR
jgi:hypothetical protein